MDTPTQPRRRSTVVIQQPQPQPEALRQPVPKLSITRNSTTSTSTPPMQSPYAAQQAFPPRRTITGESSLGHSAQAPPATPLGLTRTTSEGYPFPYTTRTGTGTYDVSQYPTTTTMVEDVNEDADQDGESVPAPDRLNDRMPRARPAVDYQDMLWTQIDILDDVRRMAEQSSANGSFFSQEHAQALAGLRGAQNALLKDLKGCEKVLDSADDHKVIWDSNGIESVRERLYNREHFENVKQGLAEVKASLGEVGESMRKVDERIMD